MAVAVTGTEFPTVQGRQPIIPSDDFGGDLVERIISDVRKDRQEWSRKIDEWVTNHRNGEPDLRKQSEAGLLAWIAREGNHSTFLPILILGETGCGKSLIAELIAAHWDGRTLVPWLRESDSNEAKEIQRIAKENALGPQEIAPFVARRIKQWSAYDERESSQEPQESLIFTFNLKSVLPTLLEAELFGAPKNAGDNSRARPSPWLMAGSGTLFLDEFLEAGSAHTALLVALQEGRIRPVAETLDFLYFCRVIVASNKATRIEDLDTLVDRGELRADILGRLSGHIYEIPPLRKRPLEIVTTLACLGKIDHRLKWEDVALRISRPALDALLSFDFPLNMRHLVRLAKSLDASVFRGASDLDLRHLGVLSSAFATAAGAGLGVGVREDEGERYVFTFDIESYPRPVRGNASAPASCHPKEREVLRKLGELKPQLAILRGKAAAFIDAPNKEVAADVLASDGVDEALRAIAKAAEAIEDVAKLFMSCHAEMESTSMPFHHRIPEGGRWPIKDHRYLALVEHKKGWGPDNKSTIHTWPLLGILHGVRVEPAR